MTDYNYAFNKYDAEKMAKAVGRDIAVSTKQAIEICSALRRKNLQDAKELLENVIELKTPIRYTRFTNGIGHRKGKMGAGAYPQKAATAFLDLLSSVEINAQNKGLNTGQLAIIHICAQKASKPMHHGRQRRSEFKRSHVEIVVAEQKVKKKEETKTAKKMGAKKEEPAVKEAKPEVKKEAPKTEVKPEVKKEAPKPEAAPKDTNPEEKKADVKESPAEKEAEKKKDNPDQDKKEEAKEDKK